MRIDQLVFVGLNGYALALNRDTGEIVWSNNELKSGPVTLLLDGDRLIVSTGGYMFCLNPLTGEALWSNPLTGYGLAAPTAIVSVRGQSSQMLSHVPDTDDSFTTAAIIGGAVGATSGS
jgi:outer membrane protein assembly factor BamB